MEKQHKINRESLLNGEMRKLVESRPGAVEIMSDAVREQLVADTIAAAPEQDSFRVFAYGSLIWNPAIEFESRHRCTIEGYHRSFCFWTVLGRGSEDCPGLMMGLEPGGHCDGIAYSIAPDQLQSELDILFRREMISNVYKPTWVTASYLDTPGISDQLLTFVIDPENDRFCGQLEENIIVDTLSKAVGPLGRNCDYLYQLVEHLDELGFEDPVMTGLAKKVRQHQALM